MLSFLKKYGANVHSQNSEDGVIAECVQRIGYLLCGDPVHFLRSLHCVEVGAADGFWMSNTRNLIEHGASGLMVESDFIRYQQCVENWKHNPRVRCQCSHVDGNNVNAFVDDRCDVFSTDTDGGDYEIFKGLKAKPKIVIIEIDSSIPPDQRGFNSDGGAGYLEMILLAYRKGYTVLCHTGNLVLIRGDLAELFPEIKGTSALSDWDLYFNRSWLKEGAA